MATATAKKATSKKASKKTAAKKGGDLIEDTVNQLENLNKASALKQVPTLIAEAEFNYFKLGGVLSIIQENGWWEDAGHENFRQFIETEYGLGYRKAMYLIEIYNNLVESGVKWDQVKDIGWTSLKELAKVLTPDNVDEWVQRAKEMTTIELQEYIKASKASGDSDGGAEEGEETTKAAKVSTLTFKLHEDQRETVRAALDDAREKNGTEYDSVALEYICMQYLEGNLGKGSKKSAPKPKLVDLMKDSSIEEVLEQFEKVFPDVDLTVELPDE